MGSFDEIALDLDDAGLDSADIRLLIDLAEEQRAVLDEISEPRFLHGDLWIGNMMLAADSRTPRITGVFDCDRASWAGYDGAPGESEGARVLSLFYQARSLGEARLEYHRLHKGERTAGTYPGMADIINALRCR